jgi:hypothetical protein
MRITWRAVRIRPLNARRTWVGDALFFERLACGRLGQVLAESILVGISDLASLSVRRPDRIGKPDLLRHILSNSIVRLASTDMPSAAAHDQWKSRDRPIE